MSKKLKEVSVQDLRRVCEPAIFHFTDTSELPTLTGMIGQERAVRATSFGIDIASPGYHIFALGPAGTGKADRMPRANIQKTPSTIPFKRDSRNWQKKCRPSPVIQISLSL